MSYLYWLIAVSLAFAVAERVHPARPAQRARRPQLANDLFYLTLHGYLWAALFGGVEGWFANSARGALATLQLAPERGWLADQAAWMQFAIYFVVSDFLQWCVHNLLHRVPALWQLHKLHHSIRDMDWAGNFRFHWIEPIVYGSILYLPLLYLGGDPAPLLAVAVFGTAWGHLNHANLNVSLGKLGYLFNSPRMHLWHHDASQEGGVAKNFGVVLSLWDHVFGTAYWPRDRAPQALGYDGDEEMPPALWRQLVFPLLSAKH